MELEPRRARDMDACVALLAAVHAADGYPARWPGDPVRWLTPPELLAAWVARRGDQVVGHVCVCRPERDASAAVWSAAVGRPPDGLAVVTRLCVAPGDRRLGLGRSLLGAACEEARRLGRHPVLELLMPNDAAAALYERLGWRRAGPPDSELRRYVAPMTDEELSAADRELVEAAREVSRRAYAPASGFAVGCAVRTDRGATYAGCNVENASFGLTICAERAAVAAAVAAEGPRTRITAVAVHADADSCSPCGACRQVIAELGPDAVVVYRLAGRSVRRPISELLPDAFTLER